MRRFAKYLCEVVKMDAALLEIFRQAKAQQASDVYLLPKPEGLAVMLRVPSGPTILTVVAAAQGRNWINALKYDAGMNVSETRRVQLGAVTVASLQLTLRLSTVADFQAQETLVARLIYGVPPLDSWSRPVVTQLLAALQHTGMLVLCGPTGSGKTTLLYQIATELAATQMVMTIEDPVEIWQPTFLQLQVNPEAAMSYAALLKAALRHRPDVLVIGEIRDLETATIACEAAISGHTVLTTVHANRADLVWLRLQSLGVAPQLVAAAVRVAAAVKLAFTPVVHPEVTLVVGKDG